MNWGRSMLLVYIGFVAIIVFMVVKSFSHDVDLVTDDYYAEELRFQDRIDAEKNALPLKDSIEIAVQGSAVVLQFPAGMSAMQSGEAYFYRASDSDRDIRLPMSPNDSGIVRFDKEAFTKGFYTVKLSWTSDGKPYFVERNIYL